MFVKKMRQIYVELGAFDDSQAKLDDASTFFSLQKRSDLFIPTERSVKMHRKLSSQEKEHTDETLHFIVGNN